MDKKLVKALNEHINYKSGWFLSGPRCAGKYGLIYQFLQDNGSLINLDDEETCEMANRMPKHFLSRFKYPVIILEIQRAPKLLDAVLERMQKQMNKWDEEGKKHKFMYAITCSHTAPWEEGFPENFYDLMQPEQVPFPTHAQRIDNPYFSPTEKLQDWVYEDLNPLYLFESEQFMAYLVDNSAIEGRYEEYSSPVDAYLDVLYEQDFKGFILEDHKEKFLSFVKLLAQKTAKELEYESLAKAVKIDVRTCKRWVLLMEQAGIIHLLQPYKPETSNRVIRADKCYFLNTGLCAALWPEGLTQDLDAFINSYVVGELIKDCKIQFLDVNETLFFYRDIDKKEVDVLFVSGGTILPIFIRKQDEVVKHTKHYRFLRKYNMYLKHGFVVDFSEEPGYINENVDLLPISFLTGYYY